MGRVLGGLARPTDGMLLGRRTYEQFADFWPKQPGNPYTEALNKQQKYVVSSTLHDPDWVNSTVISIDDVPDLKRDKDLVVLGSGALLRSVPHLIDEYLLLIHPLTLGTGQHLFDHHQALDLTHTETTTTGVVICRYRPVQTATAEVRSADS